MSQFFFTPPTIDPATTSGAELADWLSQWAAAERSGHSGNAQPSYAVAGLEWFDTATANVYKKKLYDGAASFELWQFNTSTDILTLQAHRQGGDVTYDSGAQILLDDSITSAGANLPWCFEGDTDLGGYRKAANTGVLASNSQDRLEWNATGVVAHGAFSADGTVSISTTTPASFSHTVDSAGAGPSWTLTQTKPSAVGAVNDAVFTMTMIGEDAAGDPATYGMWEVAVDDAAGGAEEGFMRWRLANAGVITSKLVLSALTDSLRPAGNAGANSLSLGTALFRWQGLHLDGATEINWNNGAVRLSHDSGNDRLDVNAGGFNVNGPLTVNGTDFSVTNGSGVVNTVGSYRVAGTKVLGARITGWGTPTGTLSRTALNTGTATLADVAQHLGALITDWITHGAIGS